jgi:hypothetical protein
LLIEILTYTVNRDFRQLSSFDTVSDILGHDLYNGGPFLLHTTTFVLVILIKLRVVYQIIQTR